MCVFEAALGPVLLAEHLAHQLLPAVAALGHGRVGIRLLQRRGVGSLLQLGVVGAGGRGEEIPLGARAIRRFDHVRVDEDAAQALDPEPLDEAHAAHVGREVVDLDRALARPPAVLLVAQVQAQALHAGHALVPLGQRLLVDGPNPREALVVEIARQRPGDESAGPADDDQIVFLQDRSGLGILLCSHVLPFR